MRALRAALTAALIASGLILLTIAPAQAATFTVTKTADTNDGTCDADCSLREAVQAANALGGADTITLPAGTYTLTGATNEDNGNTGDLDVKQSLAVVGAGTATTIIDGNDAERIFDVFPSAATTFALTDLTLSNGNTVTTSFKEGAALYLHNNVTSSLTRVAVTGNDAGANAAIENRGSLTVTDSSLTNNTSNGTGGAIHTAGALTMSGTTVSGNAAAKGGGVYVTNGAGVTTTITDSVISGNTAEPRPGGADAGDGGGIATTGTQGTLTISRAALAGNTATRNGGGIFFSTPGTGTLAVDHSRITGNTAVTSGGGIHQASGTVTAEKNWWGCNAGPGTAGCDVTAGTVDSDPHIVLRHTASPASIGTGGSSTLTADFLRNSDASVNTGADLAAFGGLPVTFDGAVLGTISSPQATFQSDGTATATYTAGGTSGAGSADATADSETETAAITVTVSATTVTSIDRSSPPGAATNTANVTFRVTFADAVSGVGPSNFSLTVGGSIAGASVSSATPVGASPATQWDVVVSTVPLPVPPTAARSCSGWCSPSL